MLCSSVSPPWERRGRPSMCNFDATGGEAMASSLPRTYAELLHTGGAKKTMLMPRSTHQPAEIWDPPKPTSTCPTPTTGRTNTTDLLSLTEKTKHAGTQPASSTLQPPPPTHHRRTAHSAADLPPTRPGQRPRPTRSERNGPGSAAPQFTCGPGAAAPACLRRRRANTVPGGPTPARAAIRGDHPRQPVVWPRGGRHHRGP